MKQIISQLMKIANELDSKGLFAEANALDEIIREAIDFGGQSAYAPSEFDFSKPITEVDSGVTKITFPDDVMTADSNKSPKSVHNFAPDTIRYDPVRQRWWQTIRQIGKELGMPETATPFRVLQEVNRQFPGTWIPGSKQKATEVLSKVQNYKQSKEFDLARQTEKPTPIGQRREPAPQMQSIGPLSTDKVPSVSLPEKEEFKI